MMQTLTNPFATRWTRPGAIPFQFPVGISLENVLRQFEANGLCGAIVGPHGTGKSTLVSRFIAAYEASGRGVTHIRLHDGQRRLPRSNADVNRLEPGAVLVIDGYEQLGWWHRRRVRALCRRRRIGLLVTAHRSCGLPVIYRTGGNLTTVRWLIDSCLPPHEDKITALDIENAFLRHGGNVREVFFELYDVFEARRGQVCSL
jgi:hypothetical protein